MAEKSLDASIEARKIAVTTEAKAVSFAVRGAYVLAAVALAIGFILALMGQTVTAIAAFSTKFLIGAAQLVRSVKDRNGPLMPNDKAKHSS